VTKHPPGPLVIAHRGASGTRPENTFSAYERALALGADMIEIDLHLTRDGAIVITHDEDLSGLGGDGTVGDVDLASVRSLDAGDGQSVPTLAEVLDRFGLRIPFNLELKTRSHAGAYPGLEEAALEAVEARGLLDRTLFSCFDDTVLERIRELRSQARIALLVSPRTAGREIARARALAAEALNPWIGMASPQLVSEARSSGLGVFVFTVDQPADMRRLVENGVTGLFTNFPERMRALWPTPAGATGDSG
jgi:glycerophosphoryl diester phosphodiesterase